MNGSGLVERALKEEGGVELIDATARANHLDEKGERAAENSKESEQHEESIQSE